GDALLRDGISRQKRRKRESKCEEDLKQHILQRRPRECAGFETGRDGGGDIGIRAPDAANSLTQRRPITATRTADGDEACTLCLTGRSGQEPDQTETVSATVASIGSMSGSGRFRRPASMSR